MMHCEPYGGRGELEKELVDMLDVSVDCIKIISPTGMLLHINRSGCEALGLAADQALSDIKWLDLLPQEVRARGQRALRTARTGKKTTFSGQSRLPGCNPVYWDNILTPVIGADGDVSKILCVSRDVTRQLEAERKLRLASDFDHLTRMPNRRSFVKHGNAALRKARKGNARVGVLIIDLDDFKLINDCHGHEVGDRVLEIVADVMQKTAASDEFVARLGGDEFVVLKVSGNAVIDMSECAARYLLAIDSSEPLRDFETNVRASIGVAVCSSTSMTLSELLGRSDKALYKSKVAGKARFTVH